MRNLIYCEFLKLKRSKIVLFSVLGVLSTPVMMLVEALQTHFEHPEKIFTLSDVYDSSLLYVMLLMNMMVYVAITAYLFSREYSEKTLKMILPSPVSRKDFIISKFLMLYVWIAVLTIITWLAIFLLMSVYHIVFVLKGFRVVIALRWLLKFLSGSILMFLTLAPFAYIAEKTKGFVIPVIISAVIVMGSAAVTNQKIGAVYPWTAGFFIVAGRVPSSGYSMGLVLGIICIVSIMGFYSTFKYFCEEDLK